MLVERLLRIALLGSTWVLYLLIGLSVVSLSAAFERWIFFARHRDDLDALAARFSRALEEEDFGAAHRALQASKSFEAKVVLEALRWAHGGSRAFDAALDSALARARAQLRRSTNLLGTLGNNAPFVGLLGTVIGVIDAFHQLGDAGQNKGAMGSVMGGIAEALVATGVGLFVALPAVVAFNLVQKKVGEVDAGVQALGKLVEASLEAHEHAGKPRPSFVDAAAGAVLASVEPTQDPRPSTALRAARTAEEA